MTKPTRRKSDMASQEAAYRNGLRRRSTDQTERLAYFGMLSLMLIIFISIGILSWLAY